MLTIFMFLEHIILNYFSSKRLRKAAIIRGSLILFLSLFIMKATAEMTLSSHDIFNIEEFLVRYAKSVSFARNLEPKTLTRLWYSSFDSEFSNTQIKDIRSFFESPLGLKYLNAEKTALQVMQKEMDSRMIFIAAQDNNAVVPEPIEPLQQLNIKTYEIFDIDEIISQIDHKKRLSFQQQVFPASWDHEKVIKSQELLSRISYRYDKYFDPSYFAMLWSKSFDSKFSVDELAEIVQYFMSPLGKKIISARTTAGNQFSKALMSSLQGKRDKTNKEDTDGMWIKFTKEK